MLLQALVILCFAATCPAEVYQYFDEEGTLVVTNVRSRVRPGPDYHNRGAGRSPRLDYRNDTRYDYYLLDAATYDEAVRLTGTSGPLDQAEKRPYAAQTRWTTGWSYKIDSGYIREGDMARVSLKIFDIDFASDILVVLPALSDRSVLNYHDARLWEGYVGRLLEHEHDHVRIIQDPVYKKEALRRFSGISELTVPYSPESDMDALIRSAVEAETFRIGHELILAIKKRNDEYDRLTGHGLRHELRTVFFGEKPER